MLNIGGVSTLLPVLNALNFVFSFFNLKHFNVYSSIMLPSPTHKSSYLKGSISMSINWVSLHYRVLYKNLFFSRVNENLVWSVLVPKQFESYLYFFIQPFILIKLGWVLVISWWCMSQPYYEDGRLWPSHGDKQNSDPHTDKQRSNPQVARIRPCESWDRQVP